MFYYSTEGQYCELCVKITEKDIEWSYHRQLLCLNWDMLISLRAEAIILKVHLFVINIEEFFFLPFSLFESSKYILGKVSIVSIFKLYNLIQT